MSYQKRKKLFYVPGIISLLVLPLIFIHYLPKLPQKKFGMKVLIARNNPKWKKENDFLSKQYFLNNIKYLKKTEIYLNEDTLFTDKKIDYIFQELQRLAFTDANKEVLIVHVNDQINFGKIVGLLNLPVEVGLHRYAFWDNEFYFVGNEKDIKTTSFICGTNYEYFFVEDKKSYFEIIKSYIFGLYKNKTIWILFGFIIFCLSIFIITLSKNPPLPKQLQPLP